MSSSGSPTARSAEGAGALAGRSAVVTGASRGIGLAAARALTAAGVRIALISRRAEALASIARELGGRTIALPCDLADRDAVERVARQAAEHFQGAPDILINNAGTFDLARVDTMPVEAFARTIEVNLIAPFALARALLPAMRARGSGHVVTIGSIADRVAFPENGAYAASKFGVRALHEVMRAECHGSGVRATLVSPGPVDTELWDPVGPDEREGFTPRDRMLRADSVAAAILYVVSQPPDVNVDELRLSRA